eukprot:scaffold91542_cov48-Attheya_sp.AAC.1
MEEEGDSNRSTSVSADLVALALIEKEISNRGLAAVGNCTTANSALDESEADTAIENQDNTATLEKDIIFLTAIS